MKEIPSPGGYENVNSSEDEFAGIDEDEDINEVYYHNEEI